MSRFATFRTPVAALPALLSLILAGCAGQVGTGEQQAAPDYVPDASYHILMGEMAMQRGEYFVTAQEFAEAARLSDDPAVASRAAEYAYNYGFESYAVSTAERWLELAPDEQAPHGYLGLLYLKQGDAEKAFVHLDGSMPPADVRVEGDYLSLESSLAAEGRPETSYAILKMFDEQYGPNVGLTLALSEIAGRNGDGEAAVAYAREVLDQEPELLEARIALYHGQLLTGETDAALASMAALLEDQPGVELELEYARLLVNAERYDEALAYLDDMEERHGFVPEIVRFHALISIDQADQVSAWSDFTKLLSAGFFVNESFFYLGEMARNNQEFLQSLRLYSRVRSGYLLVPAQVAIAEILNVAGNTEGAVAHLDEFYQQFPYYGFDVWVAKAGLYSDAAMDDLAYEAYSRALEYQPDNIAVLLGRASVLDQKGETDAAVKAFRTALRMEPDNPDAMNALGYTLANRNIKLREAEKLIASALQQHPDNAAYLDSMGWLLFRRGDYEAAGGYLEQAYAAHDDPEIAAHLGELMWAQGREGEANIIWMLALEQSPNHRVLIDTIERLQ